MQEGTEIVIGRLFGEFVPLAEFGHLVEACLVDQDGAKRDGIVDGLLAKAQQDAAHQKGEGKKEGLHFSEEVIVNSEKWAKRGFAMNNEK